MFHFVCKNIFMCEIVPISLPEIKIHKPKQNRVGSQSKYNLTFTRFFT